MSSAALRDASPHHKFPWALYLSGATGVLSSHWISNYSFDLTLEHWKLEEHQGIVLLISIASGIAALGLGARLWKLHSEDPHLRSIKRAAAYYVHAFFLVLVVGWFALSSEHWLLHGRLELKEHPVGFFLTAATLLVASWFLHSRVQEKIGQVVDIHPRPFSETPSTPGAAAIHEDPTVAADCRVLILLVSTPNIVPAFHAEFGGTPPIDPGTGKPQSAHAEVDDGRKPAFLAGGQVGLLDDIRRLEDQGGTWNWQQLMRAIRHLPALETVVLVGSKDTPGYRPEPLDKDGRRPELQPRFRQKPRSGKGSFDYLDRCRRFLGTYFSPSLRLLTHHEAVDFENFNELTHALSSIVRSSAANKVPARQILVDVTGGQKVASIAAASLTLNNELRFQYVQTNTPYESIPYDLVQPPHPSVEPHV